MYDAENLIPDRRTRKWAAACHLAGLAWFTAIPLGWLILPFIIWRMARHDHPYIDEQGREALNYQLSLTIYNIVIAAMMWFMSLIFFGWLLAPLAAILVLAEIVGCLYAAHQAYEGRPFRYPLTIPFL